MPGSEETEREGTARIVHALPGRLRVRVDSTDPVALQTWEARFRSLPGVTEVSANSATRSLLVLYDPTADIPDPGVRLDLPARTGLANRQEQPDHEQAPIRRAPSSTTAGALARRFWDADEQLLQATGGKVDLKLAIPAVLLGAGLWELLTGVEVAAATFHTLAWYSYNIFYQLHPREMQAEEPPPPN